jgi:hypothetical protein
MPRIRLPTGDTLDWVDEWTDDERHELVLENAFTRIYRARFDAGRACETRFHRHKEVRCRRVRQLVAVRCLLRSE